ncbi:MAG: V-type ATP synthase subunit I, partial [Candidatus Aenigmarchaeota archaeon]|nr:V-type ATP synthase subunit I [Candidatus Aenigmarchaeota archaeon]
LKKDLDGVSGGKIYLKRSDDSKGAPTELENPKGVKPFEFFMGLYSLPKYTEVDPTFFMFLTFPLFFGFMLGDLGYGILTFIIFWVIRSKINSKELKPVLSVMMFASFMTAVFGYIFGEFFGAEHIFGYEMHPIFHRLHDPVGLFTMSIIIGVVHVNMGLIIGFYNEFKSHGIKAALLEKASWMILQLGALAYVTINSSVGGVVIIASIIMLAMGEGVKGILELPSILTNILSYARLMAVGLASAILALVVNEMAGSAFSAGTFGIIMGAIILVAGHTIAILLGMLSPFIHSMRLHYVEFFLKFYQGGGKEYKPFGREK